MNYNSWSLVKHHLFAMMVLFIGCGSSEIEPVEIFPEDNCSHCRMAISSEQFASEIITVQREVFKFDDIGCLLTYRSENREQEVAATYLKDFDTKVWLRWENAVIVETAVSTPMGSGKVAFKDSLRAREFQKQHPANKSLSEAGCGMSCCQEM